MNGRDPVVYLVDDEPPVLRALARLLRSAGFEVEAFGSATEFIARRGDGRGPGCAVIDLAMPELTGLELQAKLIEAGSTLPVIFLTGRGDIPASVAAMKNGAVDFLTKPVCEEDLIGAVRRAHERHAQTLASAAQVDAIECRLNTLTPREREVLEHVVAGKLNKQVAADLGTVEKTIKVHRARVMQKMGADSLADLVRMTECIGIRPAH